MGNSPGGTSCWLLLRSGPELKIPTTMRVLNIAGLAIIFAFVRSTTSTASGQRWATKPYENPGGYARPPTRPNVHAPHIHKRPHPVITSTMSSPPHPHRPEHHQPVTAPDRPGTDENTVSLEMIGDMIEDDLMASEQEAIIHKPPPHTGMTSTMSGQHSQPESTETMTDDHPEHHHRPRPVMTQNPGPISETPLVSSEAASEEHTMPLVMTEDNAMMPSEEPTNAPESIEAMIEEVSEHDEIISVHEFKEVLHELVKDAVDKIVMKKVGIVGKLKTVKQNLIGHVGEATGRNPQQFGCECNPSVKDSRGRGNCNRATLDFNGRRWCYLKSFFPKPTCSDTKPSVQLRGFFWSHSACEHPPIICDKFGCIG